MSQHAYYRGVCIHLWMRLTTDVINEKCKSAGIDPASSKCTTYYNYGFVPSGYTMKKLYSAPPPSATEKLENDMQDLNDENEKLRREIDQLKAR
jgi:hypothetical protein